MTNDILLIGCGLVGKTIAKDLSKRFSVTVVDNNPNNFVEIEGRENIATKILDVRNKAEFVNFIEEFNYVVLAVPGFLGYETLKILLENGKKVVDISFLPENSFDLDPVARNNSTFAIVDCGVAPGLSNIFIGYETCQMRVNSATIYVGGLPFTRSLPFEYKAPFSPTDVLEEYIRPARYKHRGKIVTAPPLTDIEYIECNEVGTLEAFLTDGLRSLLHTVDVPDLKEKTLRYPHYSEKINFLKQCGFLSTEEIDFGIAKIKPIEFTARLLLPLWKLEKDDREFTYMKIVIEGEQDGKNLKKEYTLFDTTDFANSDSSMGRTTGFTATAVMNLIIEKKLKFSGIIPPENIGRTKDYFDYIINYLKMRGISINYREE